MQKRQREPKWVSHNKVLIGSGDGAKKPHARNPNFDCDETKLLIQLWGDPVVQRTLITVHKKHPVISKIADKMREHGYSRSTEEINTRIKNLKCLYNRIKKDLDSGLLNEPSWRHYNAMDEILSRPIFGNANNKVNSSTSKIVISPSSSVNDSSEQPILQVKEEEFSDEDTSMDFEGSELRPEDLLSVIETEHENDVEIKEEPMDISDVKVIEIKEHDNEKSDADSSTDQLTKESDTHTESKASINSVVNNNIVNYTNDSLSITSVQGNATTTTVSQISPQISNNSGNQKIRLVETKFLLKPQAINGLGKQATPTSTISTISTNAQSTMKVVFVNALNSNSSGQQGKQQITLNKSSIAQLQSQSSNPTFLTNKIIGGTTTQQKVQLVPAANFNATLSQASKANSSILSVQSNSTSNSSLNSNNNKTSSHHHHHHHQSSGKSSKSLLGNKLPVIRNLLTNIVEIENQRLEIEKQRFEYEKKVGNELLSLFKTYIQNKSSDESTAQSNEANTDN